MASLPRRDQLTPGTGVYDILDLLRPLGWIPFPPKRVSRLTPSPRLINTSIVRVNSSTRKRSRKEEKDLHLPRVASSLCLLAMNFSFDRSRFVQIPANI